MTALDDQQQRPGRRPLTTAFLRLRARTGHRGRRCRHLGRRPDSPSRAHRGQLKAGPHAGPPRALQIAKGRHVVGESQTVDREALDQQLERLRRPMAGTNKSRP
jgi:hypothetical protein